jgi:hypothetical protein
VARHGRACQFGNECLNCFFFRATASDLPDLHRTRHRKARLLVRQRARLTPQGELTNASAVKLHLEVERIDDLVDSLEQEIRSSDMITDPPDPPAVAAVLAALTQATTPTTSTEIATPSPARPRPHPDGPQTSWLRDPDGYRIELVQWPPGHADGITVAEFE